MKKSNYENLKTILLDMDGVLWRGDQPLVVLTRLFDRINHIGLNVYCVTNNSARTVKYYLKKIEGFGVDLEADQIITSAEATAAYLVDRYPRRGTLHVIGESGLIETLKSYGFGIDLQSGKSEILAVVAGLDRHLTYQKIDNAARLIRDGAEFIGTNPDQTIPGPTGISPGAGTVIGAIGIASNQQALIIGKPQSQLFNLALSRSGAAAEQALMVGDRLNTDIAGAQRLGIRTALVLSGVTTREEAKIWRPAPDIIVNNVLAVLDQIQNDEN